MSTVSWRDPPTAQPAQFSSVRQASARTGAGRSSGFALTTYAASVRVTSIGPSFEAPAAARRLQHHHRFAAAERRQVPGLPRLRSRGDRSSPSDFTSTLSSRSGVPAMSRARVLHVRRDYRNEFNDCSIRLYDSAVTTTPRLAPEWTPPERPASETREQLLAAAERLFAERGFGGVSVRMIAAEAGVNWSLVGYHFRGKDGLLAEVYRRHCATLNGERLKLLADARRAGLQLESVIEAFVRPALAEIQGPDNQNQFSRLRGMLAAENAPLFTQLVADNFDQSSRTFVAALRECLPELTADEILWRFHFMLGTIYYSASSPQRIKAFSRGRCDPGDLEATVRHLVPFLAAAFRSAPVTPARPRQRPRASKIKSRR